MIVEEAIERIKNIRAKVAIFREREKWETLNDEYNTLVVKKMVVVGEESQLNDSQAEVRCHSKIRKPISIIMILLVGGENRSDWNGYPREKIKKI